MGEVYLAQDRRLSRKVALKLLPASFTKDVDRLRRFEQEARSASALNHPNIITIYEIQEIGSTHLIATEFVEGETLRQRLMHSRLSLNETLQIAIQVADALSAAHKAGIVHRDIKPENLMLRPDGYIKVLDFGLAKLADQLSVDGEAPTVQVRTGSGVVMGTAGYMSPEQARGLPVDARSDVFSLGAVIYEMLASRKPFDGDTPSDVLAAILKTEPPPLVHLVSGLPPELVRIVGKTLRKDREERYQVIKDLLLDLKALKQELEFQEKLEQSVVPNHEPLVSSATRTIHHGTGNVAAPATREITSPSSLITDSVTFQIKYKTGAIALLALIVLLTIWAGFALYKYLNRPAATHFESMKISRLTNSGKAIDAAVSPDGKYLVYVLSDAEKQSLWIRQVSTANDREVLPPAPVGFFGMAFSLDGNDLYYALKSKLDAGTLYRVPVLGGTPVKILEGIDGPVSFSPDGKRMVVVRGNFPGQAQSALVIVNSDGSNEKTLTVRKFPERFCPIFFTGPSWSPDGKWIASTVNTIGGRSRIKIFNVDDGSEQDLNSEMWPFTARVQWLPDMSGVLAIAGDHAGVAQLWFLPYPEGKARKVTNDLNGYRAIALTADGKRLSTIQSSGIVNIWVAAEGDAKHSIALRTGNVGFFSTGGSSVSWLPDGRIAFATNESGTSDIWLMNADGSNRKQLTSNSGQNVNPTASPDGSYIFFASVRDGSRSIWRIKVDGSNPQKLTEGPTDTQPAISPDGKWLIYANLTDGKPSIWKLGIDGKNPVRLTDKVASNPFISPDGQYVGFFYPEAADPLAPPNRIGVIPISGGDPIRTFEFQVSGTIGAVGQWSNDGRSIHYLVSQHNVTNIWSQPLEGGPPKQVTDFQESLITGFAWSRDGKQLVCTRGVLMRDAVLIADAK
jgi:serine/threonine protein kinase